MKKTLSFLLLASFGFGLSSCGAPPTFEANIGTLVNSGSKQCQYQITGIEGGALDGGCRPLVGQLVCIETCDSNCPVRGVILLNARGINGVYAICTVILGAASCVVCDANTADLTAGP